MSEQDSTVVAFPDIASKSWRWIADELRSHFRAQGWKDDLIEPTLVTVGEIYMRHRDGHRVPQGLTGDARVADVNQWVTAVVIGMLVEIADREIVLLARSVNI